MKRVTKHYNALSEDEAERLAILMEEMGECIQIAGKVLRHGWTNEWIKNNSLETNREMLERELGNVRYIMLLMCDDGDVRKERIHYWADQKAKHIVPFTHHQKKVDK